MRLRSLFVLVLFLGGLTLIPSMSTPAAAQGCFVWPGGGLTLQQAVNQGGVTCVQVSQGTHLLNSSLILPAGKTLQGDPAVTRNDVILKANASASPAWPNNGGDAVVNDDGFGGAVATIKHMTLDGNSTATGTVAGRKIYVTDTVIQNGKCWGVAVAGEGVTVHKNWIHLNGAYPQCAGPPGAGIYAISQVQINGHVAPGYYSPVITNNTITNNTGPGLDIASVWGGTLTGNGISNNTSWAGVSLFGSNWNIQNNTVFHTSSGGGQPYQSACHDTAGGPSFAHSAAIMLCQVNDTNNDITVTNTVSNNRVASWYGILLVGNDNPVPPGQPYWAPRNNTLQNNNAAGSVVGLADDFAPGQWFSDQNYWSPTAPVYF